MPAAVTESLVLPPLSLALMAASEGGADFVEQFGLGTAGFQRDFEEMLRRLDAADDPEAAHARTASQLLVAAAEGVSGWFAVTSLTTQVHATYVLRRDDVAIVARPLGPVVEWVLGGAEEVVGIVEEAINEFPVDVLLSARQKGAAKVSLLIRGGEVKMAARTEADMRALASAASGGLQPAVLGVWDAIG